jgi:hypothetical protein
MDQQLEDDRLDALLREEAPYIDDAGFTARVVQQLPAPRRSRASRNLILLAFTIVATLAAYVVSGGAAFIAEEAAFLVAMPVATVWVLAAITAILVTLVGGYAAMAKARELRH